MLYDFTEVTLPLASWALFRVAHTFNVVCHRAVITRDHLTTTPANATLLQALLLLKTIIHRHRKRLVGAFIQIFVIREVVITVQDAAQEELFRSL